MKWDNAIKAFDKLDDCFKTEECGNCNYNRIGIGLCDTCLNLKFPDEKYAENHHSDYYYTKEYKRMIEEDKCEYECDWFGLVRRKK